jgi:hypothetical protein
MNNPEKTQQNTDTYRLLVLGELSLLLSTIFLDNFEIVLQANIFRLYHREDKSPSG